MVCTQFLLPEEYEFGALIERGKPPASGAFSPYRSWKLGEGTSFHWREVDLREMVWPRVKAKIADDCVCCYRGE